MDKNDIINLRLLAEDGDPDAIHRLRILENRINTLPMELRREEEAIHEQMDNIYIAYTPRRITQMLHDRLDQEKRVIKAEQEIDRLDKEIQRSVDAMRFSMPQGLPMQEGFKFEDKYKEEHIVPLQILLIKKQKYICNKTRTIAKEISGEIDQRNIELGLLYQRLFNLQRIAISANIPVSDRTKGRTMYGYHPHIHKRIYVNDPSSVFSTYYEF